MDNLDVDALFNISLDETIDIRVKKLFPNPEFLLKEYLKIIFVIYLIWLPDNYFLHLTTSFIFRQMVLLWGLL